MTASRLTSKSHILLTRKHDADLADAARRESFRKRVIGISQELAKYAAKVGTRLVPGGTD